jgi:MFS family permease
MLVVGAQLLGTSLWFSANAAAPDLARTWHLGSADIGRLTNAVQLGFILGTLGAAISGLADRYAASRIFAVAALSGALANAGFALFAANLEQALAWRFAVGLCLAGIYPIGMKLVVSWAPERAGQTLAWLVGMLTLGTALPHGLRALDGGWPWQQVVLASSVLAVIAAAAIFRLGDGPHLKPRGKRQGIAFGHVLHAFSIRDFRAAAGGYFGHMWELYAFWTLTPLLLAASDLPARLGLEPAGGTALLSFAVIASGGLGCIAGGQLGLRVGGARVAALALAASAACCLVFPFAAELPAPRRRLGAQRLPALRRPRPRPGEIPRPSEGPPATPSSNSASRSPTPRPTSPAPSSRRSPTSPRNRAEDQLEALIAPHPREASRHAGDPRRQARRHRQHRRAVRARGLRALRRRRADGESLHGPRLGRALFGLQGARRDPALPHLQPGGSDLQFLEARVGGKQACTSTSPQLVATKWNATGQCALVVGATFPAEIAACAEIVGDMPLLVPGIGAQGGDIEATVKAGRTASGTGLMINSSRAILYAGKGEDYAAAARQVALETRDAINRWRRP